MPVKKTTRRAPAHKPQKKVAPMIEPLDFIDTNIGVVHQSAPPPLAVHPSCQNVDRCCKSGRGPGHRLLMTLVGILLVYLVVFLGVLIRNKIQEFNYIGYADRTERTIIIDAEGRVKVKPDMAYIRMGLSTEADTVEEAQTKNSETMNMLIAQLKGMGIADDDIKTENYNVYPMYDWLDEGQVLSGYRVDQNLRIRIKDLTMSEKIIGLAGELEINEVGSLEYSIEDDDVYIEQARVQALKKVGQKARALTQALGVKIVGIVSYDEYDAGNNYFEDYSSMNRVLAMPGVGGSAPQIETGVNEVTLNVNVTFEIR